jgi:hypothetical protein
MPDTFSGRASLSNAGHLVAIGATGSKPCSSGIRWTVRGELMAVSIRRCVVLGLAWTSLVAQGAGASGVLGAAGPLEEVSAGGTPSTDPVIDPGLPPRSMTPETRDGFVIRTAADYGVAAADYDGDGRADLSIKLDGGTWRIDYSANGFGVWDRTVLSYGGPSATPVPADYDGDRRADLAVKDQDGTWRIDYAANGFGLWDFQRAGYGDREWRGVPADYDGDGRADIAVRDVNGTWSIDYAADSFQGLSVSYSGYGGANADAVPADYDGDRRADIAVKEDTGVWRIDYANDGFGNAIVSYSGYGGATMHAVPSDYDGDRRADLAVKNDAGRWAIDYAVNGFGSFDSVSAAAGGVTARAVPADYDGDGRADRGVRVDCGPWFIDSAADSFGAWNLRFDHMTARDVVTARDVSDLAYTLASDFTGTIFIPSNTPEMGLDGLLELPVKSCVQIIGTRQGLDEGVLLSTSYKAEPYALFAITGHDVRIQGVRLRGPSNGDRSSSQPTVTGISVKVDPALGLGGNVVIDSNEAWFWTHAAVYVEGAVHVDTPEDVPPGARMTYAQASLVRITRNSLHHNSREQRGYGVNVSHGAYATIEGNLFDHNRHAITTHGDAYTGYVARFNYVLEGGYTECDFGFCYWNQHFDVHGLDDGGYGGIGGERFEIAANTVRGEQEYAAGTESRTAFMLRGTPTVGAFFHGNVVVHDDRYEAVRIKSPDCRVALPSGGYTYSDELCHLTVGPNWYNTDTSFGLAVGDFDSDGREDVFLANGTGWWYSSAGKTEWRFLRASSLRIDALRFGQFDADPRTDVLYSTGSEWRFSSGGTGAPRLLRAGGASLAESVFGDFDGNGRTDAIMATGSTWYFSEDARSPWSLVRGSPVGASGLRVGDFDGDGRDEIFDFENGNWSWWKLGWAEAYPLPLSLTASVTGLVVGDFDGDGRDDIAQTNGDGWRYSRGASTAWAPLRGSGGQPQYEDISAVLVGRFGPDDRDDAVRYELVRTWNGYETGVRFVGWDGSQDAFVQWSPQYVR